MKKLLVSLLTLAIAVVLGFGTVGCSKKDEKKTETKAMTTETKDGKTTTTTDTKTDTKTTTPPADTKKP